MANFSSSLSHSLWVIVYQSAIRKYQLKVCLWSDSNPWPFEDCYPSRQNTCSIVKLNLFTPKIRPRWTSNFISRKWKKVWKSENFFGHVIQHQKFYGSFEPPTLVRRRGYWNTEISKFDSNRSLDIWPKWNFIF